MRPIVGGCRGGCYLERYLLLMPRACLNNSSDIAGGNAWLALTQEPTLVVDRFAQSN